MARPRPPSCGPRARCAALRHQADGSVEAFLGGRTRLADGAVIGLLHLARAVVRSDDVVTAKYPCAVRHLLTVNAPLRQLCVLKPPGLV
jgi:hypothetical protein